MSRGKQLTVNKGLTLGLILLFVGGALMLTSQREHHEYLRADDHFYLSEADPSAKQDGVYSSNVLGDHPIGSGRFKLYLALFAREFSGGASITFRVHCDKTYKVTLNAVDRNPLTAWQNFESIWLNDRYTVTCQLEIRFDPEHPMRGL